MQPIRFGNFSDRTPRPHRSKRSLSRYHSNDYLEFHVACTDAILIRYTILFDDCPQSSQCRACEARLRVLESDAKLKLVENGWGQPLNNIVRRLSSIVPVPSLRGASEGSGKQRQAKLVDQRLRTAVAQSTAVEHFRLSERFY